jgi:hypothetical protein
VPNSLTTTGLTVFTQTELVTDFTAFYQQIYGSSINLASNTPDAQQMMNFIQVTLDNANLLMQVYNSFDPDQAVGVQLDMRVAINGIQRQAGTYTITNLTVVMSQSVNLYGLDQTAQPVFTYADNAGNQWNLQTTQLGVSGTQVYAFQSATPGANLTTPNTITVPVTIVLGVTSVNNPTTYTTLGLNAETDIALRIRRYQSVALASQGYYASLLAALENITGVSSAFVFENTGGSTNAAGVPGHSIWVIVAGSGAAASIAQAIYTKRNSGCGMYGATTYLITQTDGSQFQVAWDVVVTQNLFVSFTATSVNGTTPPNVAAVRTALASSFVPGVNAEVNINQLATLVQQTDPNTLVTSAGFSLALTQTLNLSGIAASGSFVLNYNGNASAAINWNDSAGSILTKIQAVTGLTAATFTGTIAGQSLVISLGVTNALGLLTVTSNTLQTAGSAAIVATFNEGYVNTLSPTTAKNQFAVASANIIILAMQLSPASATVAHTATQQFTAIGGYGSYTWALTTNNSGGSVSGAGLYTAGSTPSVTDVVTATDAFGNTVTASITVT